MVGEYVLVLLAVVDGLAGDDLEAHAVGPDFPLLHLLSQVDHLFEHQQVLAGLDLLCDLDQALVVVQQPAEVVPLQVQPEVLEVLQLQLLRQLLNEEVDLLAFRHRDPLLHEALLALEPGDQHFEADLLLAL